MNLDSLQLGIRYADAGIATISYDLVHYYKATVYVSLV